MKTPLKIGRFTRKPLEVEAVQVTEENIAAVVRWCGGELIGTLPKNKKPQKFVKVPVNKPLRERQSRAMIGDWILKSDRGFKVYTDMGFKASFAPLKEEALFQEAVKAMREYDGNRQERLPTYPDVEEELRRGNAILNLPSISKEEVERKLRLVKTDPTGVFEIDDSIKTDPTGVFEID